MAERKVEVKLLKRPALFFLDWRWWAVYIPACVIIAQAVIWVGLADSNWRVLIFFINWFAVSSIVDAIWDFKQAKHIRKQVDAVLEEMGQDK